MRLIKLTVVALLLLTPIITIASTNKVAAFSGSDFRAGRIIDDQIFYNNNSMSVQDIQAFLNTKVPTCDTDGAVMYNATQTRAQWSLSRGITPPFICLKDYAQSVSAFPAEASLCGEYSGGQKTAAQIIKDVADACGINPQVLIVMLQREQSLVTDDWPWPLQYEHAMGFGCPDTATCDPTYSGFSNQVYHAARIFKRYAANPLLYNYRTGQSNYILYNPNSACGGSSIFIENQATASLYNYNPYQPNQAALSNLYGTGDSCSAYGNRNLWRLFNEWFGSTLVQNVAPTVDLKVNGQDSATITYDSTVTLSWVSENATSCNVEPGGYTELSNTWLLYGITENKTYTIHCSGVGGTVSDEAQVTVLPPTFDYLQQLLTAVGNGSGTNVKSIEQQLTNAKKFYDKGDKAKALQALTQAKDSISKLLNQGKLLQYDSNKLIQAIDTLAASW